VFDFAGAVAKVLSKATERWHRMAAATGIADWARGAAKKLDGYNDVEWTKPWKRISSAGGYASPYTAAMLEAALGKQAAAWAHFQQSRLLPDRMMSHHLSRMGMSRVGLPE
jgi:hypothetical protein